MKMEDARKKIADIKRKEGRLLTNIYKVENGDIASVYESEKGILYEVREPDKVKVYFAVKNEKVFEELIQNASKGAVLEYLHREIEDVPEFFNNSKLKLYKTFIRETATYKLNPYKLPEKGKRALLVQMYDPACGEYPVMDDIDELDRLVRDNFDVLTDDIFTREQWEEIIQKKECLCHRDDGMITTAYVWHLEGKKIYSNMSVNISTANFLYNLERRVFEEMWDKGIRIFYAWYNLNNAKVMRKNKKEINEAILGRDILFNSIYLIQ